MRADLNEIELIFQRAEFPGGPTLRLGNGALLTPDQFDHYENLADRVFARLRRIHALALKVQRLAFELPYIDTRSQNNRTGEALDRADDLMRSRDYSVDRAWEEIRTLADILEEMIRDLDSQLGRND